MQTTSPPTIRVRRDAWDAWMKRQDRVGTDEQAEFLGVHRATLYRVLGGDTAPGEQFIAACMAKYDRTFEELFEVTEAAT